MGAARLLEVIPELNGKLTGMTFCVPTSNVTCLLKKAAEYEDIKKMVKQRSWGPLKGILGYTVDQGVACDFNSGAYSSTFNAGASIVL